MRTLNALLIMGIMPIIIGTQSIADSESLLPKPNDLVQNIPDDFPRFYFSGHDQESKLLSNYLWYHFSNRAGNMKTLFNKEYLTTSDLWAAGAVDKARGKSIQDVHREDISSIAIDETGYVQTHQHFSHAHDRGWPFPMWTQAANSPDKLNGLTAGWHFQDSGPGWVWDMFLKHWNTPQYEGETATKGWKLDNIRSIGISDNKWQLDSTGDSPTITTPAGMEIDAFNSPFLQLRWTRSGDRKTHNLPYIEWLCEGDTRFGTDRRIYFTTGNEEHEGVTRTKHSIIEMYRHPKWTGKIKQMRISLAPGESGVKFAIDSFFTVYDTRHTINNPIFVMACWNYYRWTGDIDFLRGNINRMREALRYQQTELGGLKYNNIRNQWIGHDGRPGWVLNPDGSKTIHPGRGVGSNYWDILPFGWDDMYATSQYYASTLMMAEMEEAILANPGWGIPTGAQAFDPIFLRKHAAAVKKEANRKFWDDKKGRFVACIDSDGKSHDYGFTFLNLDAIWYGIASDDHAKKIMSWISGKRIIEGDTSTGADIYHWRFGPRATTKRNIEWYCQGWTAPEGIPWGGQVQDGGAVLGFSFYDLWARMNVLGPDDAWNRLSEIMKWEDEVTKAGGYRKYYSDASKENTLQGGGTAGGLGIDAEFFESSLLPSIATLGFLGLNPGASELRISPKLPKQCPEMGMSNLLYHNSRLDIKVANDSISVSVKDQPVNPIRLAFDGEWSMDGTRTKGSSFELTKKGIYMFSKISTK
ncbi:MAG: glycosyl hydrolase family 65 protein [Armatimonadota bacterium]